MTGSQLNAYGLKTKNFKFKQDGTVFVCIIEFSMNYY